MNWREIKNHYAMSVKALEKETGVPRRTLEDWIAGRRTPPEYITKLLIEKLEGRVEGQKTFKERNNQDTTHNIINWNHEIRPATEYIEEWLVEDEIQDAIVNLCRLTNKGKYIDERIETKKQILKEVRRLITAIEEY